MRSLASITLANAYYIFLQCGYQILERHQRIIQILSRNAKCPCLFYFRYQSHSSALNNHVHQHMSIFYFHSDYWHHMKTPFLFLSCKRCRKSAWSAVWVVDIGFSLFDMLKSSKNKLKGSQVENTHLWLSAVIARLVYKYSWNRCNW